MSKKVLLLLLFPSLVLMTSMELFAQNISEDIIGTWLINEELSDNTDDMVGEAIEAGGGRVFLTGRKIFIAAGRLNTNYMTAYPMMTY